MRDKIKPSFIMTFIFLLSACNNQVSPDTTNPVCSCPTGETKESSTPISSPEEISSSTQSSTSEIHKHASRSWEKDENDKENYHIQKCKECDETMLRARHYMSKEHIITPATEDQNGVLVQYCEFCYETNSVDYVLDDTYADCAEATTYGSLTAINHSDFISSVKGTYSDRHNEKFYYLEPTDNMMNSLTQSYSIEFLSKENDISSSPRIYETFSIYDENLGSYSDSVYEEEKNNEPSYTVTAYFFPIEETTISPTFKLENTYIHYYGNNTSKITCYSGDDIFGYIYTDCVIKLPSEDYILNHLISNIKAFN